METVNVPTPEDSYRKHNRGGRALGGLIVVAVGVIWLLKQMNFVLFPHWLFSWPMLLIVWGLYMGVRHNFKGFGGWLIMILLGGYFLIDEYFPNYSISDYFWPVAIIILGLFMILRPRRNLNSHARFHAKWNKFEDWTNQQNQTGGETSAEDYLDETSVFGGVHKVVVSKNFRGGDIVNIFGGSDINLTQADFKGTVTIDTVQIFGGAKITVPTDWKVVIKTTSVFGGVEDKRPPALIKENPDKTLIIEGTAIFGGISIQCY